MNSISKEVQENKDKINKNLENYLRKKAKRNKEARSNTPNNIFTIK